MSTSSADRVRAIFSAATQQPPADRDAFVEQQCGDDDGLRTHVLDLLAALEEAGDFMGDPTKDVAGDVDTIPETAGPPRETPGERIGRYKLLEQIGEGGFGVVWAAEQREPVRRRVALKIIKLGMDTKQVIARFEAERQALAMMDHPNIAKVLDAGATESGRPYFVMELVKGVPILEYCDTGKLETGARLDLFVKVCNAIQHAHQKGIIHRDIKPSNVLVTLHDGVPMPKVIDFGIAKATNHELAEKTIYTQHRQMIGTPAYMSPEQAEMSGLDIDTRSDVYALGVLLYELLTGTTPFENTSLMEAGFAEMMRIIREVEPPKPSVWFNRKGEMTTRAALARRTDVGRLSSLLRGDLDWIVMRCLEKDRTRRYGTATELAADIRRHLHCEPVLAGPPSRFYRVRKFVRRNRAAVGGVAALVGVLLLGALGTTVGLVQARRAVEQTEAARRESEANAIAAREEAARQRELARFFESALMSTDPWTFGLEAPASVLDLLDAASVRLRGGEMDDQPVNKAVLSHAIGYAYLVRDQWEQALEHYRLTVDLLGDGQADPYTFSRAALELDRLDAAPYLVFDVGADVLALRQRALAALEPMIARRDPRVAEVLLRWADVLVIREEYAGAADVMRTILSVISESGGFPSAALVEYNLACMEARLGNEAEARALYTSASERLRDILARGDGALADDWAQWSLHPSIGMFMDTDPPVVELIELARRDHPARNLEHSAFLYTAAGVLEDLGYADEGYAYLREAVDIARSFEDNRLALGLTLVKLAWFEWNRGRSSEVVDLCTEAQELLSVTGGLPHVDATSLIVAVLVERIVAAPDAPEAADLVRRVEDLAIEASAGKHATTRLREHVPWWTICGELARMHHTLADAGGGEEQRDRARAWTRRLRADLRPHMDGSMPVGHDGRSTALANAILMLDDATSIELERARDLARLADETTGGRLTGPVDLLARTLFRLRDVEGAVREIRRARSLLKTSEPVRGIDARLTHYEAALAAADQDAPGDDAE